MKGGSSCRSTPIFYQTLSACPIVELRGYAAACGLKGRLYAYLDFAGPTGTARDGLAEGMLALAIEKKELISGQPIIEAASGPFAAALTLAGLTAGHPVVLVMPEDAPALRQETLLRLGAQIRQINATTVEIQNAQNPSLKPHELERKLRASYYLLGVLLGKYGFAEVAMPGGCNFGGVRPIDQHIKGFEALGAKVTLPKGGYIRVEAPEDGLHGAHIYFDVVTVGATMNIMLAAVLAKGQTIMENCAKEPHIVDLANFLNAMGADVKGAGTDVIKIRGVESLHGGNYSIIPDQIEAVLSWQPLQPAAVRFW